MDQNLVNPLCIILVNNGSKGDRLVFRYPYQNLEKSIAVSNQIKSGKFGNEYEFSNGAGSPSTSSMLEQSNEVGETISMSTNRSRRGSKSKVVPESLSPIHSSAHSTPVRNPYSCSRLKISEDLFGNIKSLPSPQPPPAVVTPASTVTEGHHQNIKEKSGYLWGGEMLADLSDKDLSNLLAVNNELAERKFELKINGVRFVGHPTLMQPPNIVRPMNPAVQSSSVKLFHVVFCLNAMASYSTVKCFYDLSKRLGIGLRHEEYRCGYLSREMKAILSIHDEACTDQEEALMEIGQIGDEKETTEKTFNRILATSPLAELLRKVYEDVCLTGFCRLRINNWVQISFCLPQKVHCLPFREHAPLVEPEHIHVCLESIRAYHAVLLLESKDEILSHLWIDSSTTIHRFLQVYNPSKSLQTIAADADLTLSQSVEIAAHLVYWAKATIIYPMCESNVYVLSPDAPNKSNRMADSFTDTFPGLSLTQTMADFSLPMPLGERINPALGGSYLQTQMVQLVSWLLKNKLLIQLHTYIILVSYLDGSLRDGPNSGIVEEESFDKGLIRGGYDDEFANSDSLSEITGEDPLHLHSNEGVGGGEGGPGRDRDESISETDNIVDEEEVGEPMEKFKGTLSEIRNEPVRRALMLVRTPVSIQDIRMFTRLAKYFTGDHHLEEIMYRENIRRSQLMLLLDKFRDVLITAEYEDPDINFFKM